MSFRERIISAVAHLSWHLDYSIQFVSRNCSATITIGGLSGSGERSNRDSQDVESRLRARSRGVKFCTEREVARTYSNHRR